jgi:hypothetical protein
LAEDYAETVMEYLHKDAGLTDYTLFSPGHQKYAERFKILDEYFGVHPEVKRRVADMYRNVARITVGGSTAAVLYLGGSQMWGTYSAAPEVSTIDRQPTGR